MPKTAAEAAFKAELGEENWNELQRLAAEVEKAGDMHTLSLKDKKLFEELADAWYRIEGRSVTSHPGY